MTVVRRAPLVHGAWTADWWGGDASLADIFGPPPSLDALAATADRLRPTSDWHDVLSTAPRDSLSEDTLVVLAGQQPVLGGGAALVAHKAATAVALARHLEERWGRPVLAVFLLATQDHDTSEIDHVDVIEPSRGSLRRLRCDVRPKHEMFSRARWDDRGLADVGSFLGSLCGQENGDLRELLSSSRAAESVAGHVVGLLEATFGSAGLAIVESHRLEEWGRTHLHQALSEARPLTEGLARGAARLRSRQLPESFPDGDPRPLVLESRDGRRRRVGPDDGGAVARLAAHPEDFSPHAALRPIVQAAALPVVAQVCGPSELLYLGQARGLHDVFGVQAPVLVPRLEATRLAPGETAQDLEDLLAPEAAAENALQTRLLEATRDFADHVVALDPGLRQRVARFVGQVEKGARRLAEAPSWRGRSGASDRLRPRGRCQDTVLAWAPDAWSAGRPDAWGRHIIGLCRPLDPPEHVLHTYPSEA